MERIIIAFEKNGSLKGASATDFEGLPVPVDMAQLLGLVPEINAGLGTALDNLKADHATEVETLNANHEATVQALNADHEATVQALNADHAAEVETLRNDHAAEVNRLKGVPISGGVTKLTIKKRLDVLGKWELFKEVLAGMPEDVQDEWMLAQEIRTDDPTFVENAEALKVALGLTDEEFENLLIP